MSGLKTEKLTIDTADLCPSQVRLIKTINTKLNMVATTKNEQEFFDASAELMKLMASLVQQANFHTKYTNSEINYADQAVEFSIECVNEALQTRKIINYDN
jgi:hypothetical protein